MSECVEVMMQRDGRAEPLDLELQLLHTLKKQKEVVLMKFSKLQHKLDKLEIQSLKHDSLALMFLSCFLSQVCVAECARLVS